MPVTMILGTVQFGLPYGINNEAGKPDQEQVDEILTEAYRSGIRTLDTSNVYGDAENVIGDFHKKNNFCFQINTKFVYQRGITIKDKLAGTLKKVGVEKIQTYFFHLFTDYVSYPDLIEELKDLKNENYIRQIGISVYTNDEFETAMDDPAIDVIQIPFNLLDNKYQRGTLLIKAKLKHKIIQVRSVFLQGLFFKPLSSLPDYLQPLKPYLQSLHKISENSGLTMEDLCLQYVTAQTDIDEIIIGVDSKEQLMSNMNYLHKPIKKNILEAISAIQVKETELLYPFNWKQA
jgi:aryl-alcohol dehydrogenase-like predicted oxidoreductase